MKKAILLTTVVLSLASAVAQIPNLAIQDTLNNTWNLPDYMEQGDKNYLIAFWASWASPAKKQFNEWKNYYPAWKNQYNIEVLAISIDWPNLHWAAKQQYNANNWTYSLFFANADSAQVAFDVFAVPHIFLVNTAGQIVYEHIGYAPGDEIELNDIIQQLIPVGTHELREPPRFNITANSEHITIESIADNNGTLTCTLFDLNGNQLDVISTDASIAKIDRRQIRGRFVVVSLAIANTRYSKMLYLK